MAQQQIATAFKCDMNMLPRLASAGVVRAYKRQVLYGVTIPAPAPCVHLPHVSSGLSLLTTDSVW